MDVLAQPDKWPSVHLPPNVPDQQVELNTIIYIYEHWRPRWSIPEARALHELADQFVKRHGEKTLRRKGVFGLLNCLSFSLMAALDRARQPKRDHWVARKLKALLDSGRTDKLPDSQTFDPPRCQQVEAGAIPVDGGINSRIDIPLVAS